MTTVAKPTRELLHNFSCTVVRLRGESVDMNIHACEVPVAIIHRSDFSDEDQCRLEVGVSVSWRIYYEHKDGRRFRVSEVRLKN